MSQFDDDDVWAAFKEHTRLQKEKKAVNREVSPQILKSEGIAFDKKSDTHYKVYGHMLVVDFWPGTGLWIDIKNGIRRRGVRNLVKYIKKSLNESKDL